MLCCSVSYLSSYLRALLKTVSEVQAVDLSTQGYTQAADLWSLGVLTATMLTGDCTIPRQELVGFSQVELAERYFGADHGVKEIELRRLWLDLPPRALSFIRKLLTVDADDRMSAEESLNHPWLTKPHREGEALAEAIEKVNRFWKKRVIGEDILEALPGVDIPTTSPTSKVGRKFRTKLPDVSMASPYFGLDRHLYTREESTRKRILNDLLESGSQFVISKPSLLKRFASTSTSNTTCISDRWVQANDLFGKSGKEQEIDTTMDLDELETSPTTPPERVYGPSIYERSDTGRSPTTLLDIYEIPESEEAPPRKRSRFAFN